MIILDKTSEELVSILVSCYKRNDFVITDDDVQLPIYIANNMRDEFQKLKSAGLISRFEIYVTGNWEVGLRPNLFTYFEDKMNSYSSNNSNVANIYGNVTGLQLQQGTINSSQTQAIISEIDYESIKSIIEQIKKYDGVLDVEFGDNAPELREKINELEYLIREHNNPSRVKSILYDIKNLAIGVGGSLIASGILALIGGVI